MATGTAQLLAPSRHEEENDVSSSEEDVDGDLPPPVPKPVKDGLPQTGPKGVLTDFYRTQQDSRRKAVLEEKRRRELIQKHSATVKSKPEEDREKRETEAANTTDSRAILNLAKALEEGALDQDPFVQQYRARRMEEMKAQAKLGNSQRMMFGNLIEIRGSKIDNVVETAPPQTFIVIHIYDEMIGECQLLNKCLTRLAKQYTTVKFCRVQSHQLNSHLSSEFLETALPAMLVYQGGHLVGNLLRVTQTLKDEFTEEDVEMYLHEHSCLPPDSEKEELLSSSAGKKLLGNSASSDSD
ncbi:Phosducin-like protein [Geodia barretti]|uniref:Phosducin-like protein n=3 Tax=Geodia barretti TaxID=519541 RepID=A0AA35RIV1_GEOBA|nr:Phosducin-like protein [Geodia barretti]